MKKNIVIIVIISILIPLFLYSKKEDVLKIGIQSLSIFRDKTKKSVETEIGVNKKYIWGLDLSHHQQNINWDKLAKSNKPYFIFFKTTEGKSFTDPAYKVNIIKARKLGIKVGAYHFFKYQTNGAIQAKHFIRNAKLKNGDLLPVLDVEFNNNMPAKSKVIAEIQKFCNVIETHYGVKPIIYCETDFYTQYLSQKFRANYYWISDFYREPRCRWTIWQYTDKAIVKGIKGNIDKNVIDRDFYLNKIILKY